VIEVKLSAVKGTKPHEYLIRFLLGGSATVLAGLLAQRFGPGIGGLFLAFPAIFPATATLLESHERKRKERIGCDGTVRGRMAASIDAAGAALGSIGLCAFAVVLWRLLPRHNAALVIAGAAVVWTLVSCAGWEVRKNRMFGLRRSRRAEAGAGS
jgi:hypothetical protein